MKTIIGSSNKLMCDKLNQLHVFKNVELDITGYKRCYITKILRTINARSKVIDYKIINGKLYMTKVNPVNYQIYYKPKRIM